MSTQLAAVISRLLSISIVSRSVWDIGLLLKP